MQGLGRPAATTRPLSPSPQELAAALVAQQRAGRAAAAATSDDDEEEGEEEGGRQGGGAVGPAPREAIYNVEVLHDKLEDIGWSEEQPWEESMALTSSEPVVLADAEDDLERELAFYNQVGCMCGPVCAVSVRLG